MFRILTIIMACLPFLSFGQEIEKDLKHFTRVVASPRVNVILEKGDREAIRLTYRNTTADKINIFVRGKTLRIYLDRAKKVEPMDRDSPRYGNRDSMYEDVVINAYVTYRDLDMLEIRGNQELVCEDALEADAFTLRAYGSNEIRLASLKTAFFKAKLYGENNLMIRKGRTLEQKYLLYGENKIDTDGMRSDYIITSIFGEGSLRVNSAEEVRIDAFGEPRIYVNGGAHVNRRLVIGNASIFTH